MRNRRSIDITAGLVVLGAAAVAYFTTVELPPAWDRRPHEASGWVMAQEAVRRLESGGRLTVIRRDTDAFPHPEADVQFRAFEKAVRKARGTIASVHALQLDPLRPLEVPPGDFFELIRRSPSGSVIVSFMGPPLLTAEQRLQLGEIRPRILAFCPGALPAQIDLRLLFGAGLLDLAVVSRPQGPDPAASSRGLQGSFDRHYRRVTGTDVAGLYEGRTAPP